MPLFSIGPPETDLVAAKTNANYVKFRRLHFLYFGKKTTAKTVTVLETHSFFLYTNKQDHAYK